VPLRQDQEQVPLRQDQERVPLRQDQEQVPLRQDQERVPLRQDQEQVPLRQNTYESLWHVSAKPSLLTLAFSQPNHVLRTRQFSSALAFIVACFSQSTEHDTLISHTAISMATAVQFESIAPGTGAAAAGPGAGATAAGPGTGP
jgi:hypothetical protein